MQRDENGVLICSDELLLQAVAAFRHLTVQRCTKQSRLWILWELIPLNFCTIHFQKWPASWHWSRESRAPALRQGKLNVGGWSAYRKPIVICMYIYIYWSQTSQLYNLQSSPVHCRATAARRKRTSTAGRMTLPASISASCNMADRRS